MNLNSDVLEIDTKNIQDFFGHSHVNRSELEGFLEQNINAQLAPQNNTPQTQNTISNGSFTVSQQEYITFLLYRRDKLKKDRKRFVFKKSALQIITWLFKIIGLIILFMCICYGFYLLAWFIQTSLTMYRMNLPVVPNSIPNNGGLP